MKEFYVYEWFIKDTNEIFYVGKGCNNRVTSMKDRNEYFKNIRKKYDCDYRIIKYFDNENEAYDFELKRGIELKDIGQARACYVFGNFKKYISDEIKNKMKPTQFKKNFKPWNYGKKNCYSKELLEKMRNAKLGIKQSEETKQKRSKSLMQKIIAKDIHTNKIIKEFNSINDGAKYFNINASCISKQISGINKTCVGYKWEKVKQGNTESV